MEASMIGLNCATLNEQDKQRIIYYFEMVLLDNSCLFICNYEYNFLTYF